MDRLMLVLPTEQHKQAVWDYREEFLRNQDSGWYRWPCKRTEL